MWIERLQSIVRFPTPYDGDHVDDPLFKYEARQAAMVGSPLALRRFNRQVIVRVAPVVAPLLLYPLVAPQLLNPDRILFFMVTTFIVWAISILFDELHLYFAANSMVALKTNGSLEFVRATPLNSSRLLAARYQIALLHTWRVFWLSVIVRYVLVLFWFPFVAYSIFIAARRIPFEPLESAFWLTAIIVGYAGGSYIAIREPLWRWRIMTAIGLQSALLHHEQGAVILRAVLLQVGFGLVRYVLLSLGAYGVFIGVTVLYALGIWITDALFAVNAGLFGVLFVVPLTAVGVLLPVWIYRFAILLNRDWYSGSTNAIRHIRIERLLHPEE